MAIRQWFAGYRSVPMLICGSALSSVSVLAAGNVFAQEGRERTGAVIFGAMIFVFLLLGLAAYVYFALALQTIAKKTNTENAWLAWVPILHFILMLNIGKKPLWWFVLCLIPVVNVVIMILIWMAIAEARGKPNWWGILMIVPLVNLIVPGYLAWAD